MSASNKFYTFFIVSLCLISSSIEPIITKAGYRFPITPFQLLFIKFLVGGIVILPLTRKFEWIGFKGLGSMVIAGLLLMTTSWLVLLSLKYLTAIVVITIITTTPAFVGIVNQFLGKDVLGRKFWLGFFIAFIGILLSIEIHKVGELSFSFIGLLSVFVSVITSTIYRTRLDDLTKDYTPVMVSNYMFIIDALISICFLPFVWPIPNVAIGIGLVIGIAAALANITFLWAIHLMGSTKMSIIGLLQRPIVIICAALILKEPLSLIQITGIVMVFIGIQMAKVIKKKPVSMMLNQYKPEEAKV